MTQTILAKMKAEEREKRRQFFIDAAFSQLKLKDPGQLTVKDIAAVINVSVPSVYTYFPSKDDLYIEILNRDALAFKRYINDAGLLYDRTPEDRCSDLMRYVMGKPEISSLMVYFIGKQRSLVIEQRQVLKQIQDTYLESFKRINGEDADNVFNTLFMLSIPALSKANESLNSLAS